MGKSKRLKKYKKEGKDLEKDIMEAKVYQTSKAEEEELSKLKDDDLFVINEGKTQDIKRNREKLKADRFKQYNVMRSRSERDKIKELMKKPELLQPKKKNNKKNDNLFDIWNTPEEQMGMKKISKNRKKDREYLNRTKDNIKRVVVPSAGISYNPPAAEHKKVIEDVVVEEIEDMRKETQLEQELDPRLRPEMDTLEQELADLKEF